MEKTSLSKSPSVYGGCAAYLAEYGPSRGAAVARDTGVKVATRLMADNHYGWFERRERGIYALADAGRRGLADWADVLPEDIPAEPAEISKESG